MTSYRTFTQSFSSFSVCMSVIIDVVTNLEADLLVSGLFSEPTGGEGLLHVGGDEDAAFAMLGARAAVEADTGTSGDLDEDG